MNKNKVNLDLLKIKQSYPLDMKIEFTKKAIEEYVAQYGFDGVYVSFSGGKDSTVLLHIIYSMYGSSIQSVFSNTKNEFDSVVNHVNNCKKWYKNIITILPSDNIETVIENYGYPVVSKKVSRMLSDIQNPTSRNELSRRLYLTGVKSDGSISKSFKLSDKYFYLIDSPFKISHKCCDILKKKPLRDYEKKTGKKPILGTMACESDSRTATYLKHGCNNFVKCQCMPLGFWTEQDILNYIIKYNLEIASVYGEIKQDKSGKYYTTGEQRTGCVACILGMEFERKCEKNRLQRLKEIEPRKYDYVINRLGFKHVLDYMGYKY